MRLIDLSDESRSPGINLLDTRVFADRDRTADSVVRVAKGLWEQWGPRMQSILEQTVKTLHEANEQVEAEQQYTILDGLKPPLRRPIPQGRAEEGIRPLPPGVVGKGLRQVAHPVQGRGPRPRPDPPLLLRILQAGAGHPGPAPLHHRPAPQVIHDGGVLLVSTSQGTVGRDVAALVGASLLNLVDAVIREQGSLPFEQASRRAGRRGRDAVDAQRGLRVDAQLSWASSAPSSSSQPRASQSWTTSPAPCATPCSPTSGASPSSRWRGTDARTLVWELGKERVTEDDITSLPVHHCYVRATVGKERMPAFSMMVRKPEDGDPETGRPRPRGCLRLHRLCPPGRLRRRRRPPESGANSAGASEDLEGDGEQQQEPDAGKRPERRSRRSRRNAAADADRDATGEAGREDAEEEEQEEAVE